MKRIFPLVFLAGLISACVKDRVPDPSTLNPSQTAVANENFDADTLLPSGWSASPSSGWKISTSNSSAGYDGASGVNNIEISNATGFSGDFTLTSKSVATTGFKNIAVIYGVRNTTHFSDSGSVISSFAYSIDSGMTWKNLTYTENANNSLWALINGGLRITVPADANNLPAVKFQWTAHLKSTSSGTYRFDDFQVFGTPAY